MVLQFVTDWSPIQPEEFLGTTKFASEYHCIERSRITIDVCGLWNQCKGDFARVD